MYRYNSRVNKAPFGAVSENEVVKITFPITRVIWVNAVRMKLRQGDKMRVIPLRFSHDDGAVTYFECEFSVSEAGIYYYQFEVELVGGGIHHIGTSDNGDALCGEMLPEWQLTVYSRDYKVPQAMKGGIIYHIFVDRFCHKGAEVKPRYGVLKKWGEPVTIKDADGVYRANDFYGGNFQGIISKLDYLQELGVTMLYLSPIFESNSNHRYDTADYLKIDPMLGTEEDFNELIARAKQKGMGVMLDGVFNHTGADSIYFNQLGHYDSIGAIQSKESPYYDWYYFSNYPYEYDSWWGVKVVPTLNKGSKGFRKLLLGKGGIIDKWTNFGISAWRLDVVDELPVEFVDKLREAVKTINKDVSIIGEVWEDASVKVSYSVLRPYFTKGQLDGVMNYPYMRAIIDYVQSGNPRRFIVPVMRIMENYPKDALLSSMTLLGSHDTVRILNSISGADVSYMDKAQRQRERLFGDALKLAKSKLKVAVTLQYMLPGVPSVYYGDEIGMQGYEDPLNRETFDWDNMDTEILDYYKILGRIRREYHECMVGSLCFFDDVHMLAFRREGKDGSSLYVVANVSFDERSYRTKRSMINIITGDKYPAGSKIIIEPCSVYVLTVDNS